MTATIHSPHRILIADDEQAIRDEFLRVLCPAASNERGDKELAELKLALFDRSPEEAADRFATIGRTFEPDPKRAAQYAERFAIYRDLYPNTRDLSHRLAALADGSS